MVEKTRAETIFGNAIDIGSIDERKAFLDEACHGDPILRQEVEKLVQDHFRAGDFLKQPVAQIVSPTIPQPITEKPGTQIGPYKLLQQIGEGGMGVVYMAEQKEPVKRRVALKIIKPGMDTHQVIARFEAERQALAMMDHPNIAKVLDAGTTENGRPFFVMELVKGVPVTQYCDQQHLTPRERLELFVPICQAVQHAHQKGIIHRDLKPSNILVALFDGQPVPKVIDFGVAKATSQTLTEKTMFTQLGQIVGTLEYMSPEQAQVNQLDVDTRSDIYSLGVLLYELLTGDTPFDRQRLRSEAFDEMLRIIREEEPPKPSTKLSSSAALPSIAANRHVEPQKLSLLVRGELDWIVMKALEKDRGRRYETASKFVEDIQHYLNDEPVVACPPSSAYRFKKFARRNKTPLAISATAALVLVLAALVSSIAAIRFQKLAKDNAQLATEKSSLAEELQAALAESQANLTRARDQEQKAKENLALATSEQRRAEENLNLAIAALDDLYLQALGRDRLLGAGDRQDALRPLSRAERELLEAGLGFYSLIAAKNESSAAAKAASASAFLQIALLQANLEEYDAADKAFSEAITRFEQLTESFPENALYFTQLGKAFLALGYHSRWWPSTKDTFVDAERALTQAIELDPSKAELYLLRGSALERVNKARAAVDDYSQAVQLDPDSADLHGRLGIFLVRGGLSVRDVPRSIRHLQKAIELDPSNATWLAELGRVYWVRLRDREQALKAIDRAIETDPNLALAYIQRQVIWRDTGDLKEALNDIEKAIQLEPQNAWAARERAIIFTKLGRYEEAIKEFDRAELSDPHSPWVYSLRGGAYSDTGQYAAALRDYTKALELSPRYWIYYKNRAAVYFHLKQYQLSLADLAESLELNPKDVSALVWIPPAEVARCPDEDFKHGLLQLADMAVQKDPDNTQADANRARILQALGRDEEAPIQPPGKRENNDNSEQENSP